MAPQGIHGLQVWAMAPSFPSLATSMACEQSGPGGRDGLYKHCQVTSAESAKRHQQWSVRNKVVRPVPAAQGSSGVDILVPRAPENSPTDLKVEATASKLDSLELNKSKLGETIYQLDKFDIRTKCKNISMEFYGESSDKLEIESIGIVCKLGKVKN